jgi:small-conductance mechanosensitive channel
VLSRSHETLEQHVREEKPAEKAAASQVAVGTPATSKEGESYSLTTAAALSSLRHLSDDQKNLADLDKRIQDLQQLAGIYGQWNLLVRGQDRLAVHSMIASALWIVLTLVFVFVAQQLTDRFLGRLALERKQQLTLRVVLRFSLQALAALVVLFAIFGRPNELPTILGLAGAGLTVVLKDFIVSFLGWFVLMGRNGIRVGDWVEINGVRGEAVEIGLLRTVLLETGNWTDAGHPTGRQVAFLNSYAIEGWYFNFTTSGQWLWDELRVLIPSSENPYPLVEKIRDIVVRETESNAPIVERDWQRVTRRYGVKLLSSVPVVDVRPTDLGVEVIVRYMTRASERSEVRSRLNHAVVELLHRGKDVVPAADIVPAPSGHG